MKVVHVNFDAATNGGASIAMLRIHHALRRVGLDSVIACRTLPNDMYAHQYKMPFWRRAGELGYKVVQQYILRAGRQSAGLFPTGMANYVNSLKPDIVQLNWLQANTIGIRELLKIKCPIVWFTHDLWPMSGLYPYPQDDWFKKGSPTKGPWLNKVSWANKRDVVNKLRDRITVVSPSEWARDEAKTSVVFRGIPCSCIHYPVTETLVRACESFTNQTKPRNSKFTILFGATTGIGAAVKGWDRLMAALDLLTETERADMRIRVFGCDLPAQKMHGVDVVFVGKKNEAHLIPEYRNADVFAFPSRRETWGQTKTESLCCGTPVIAFDQTACANGIRHKVNGWVSPANDIDDFASGLRWFYHLWKDDRQLVINSEVDLYRPEVIGMKWFELYEQILMRGGSHG